MKPIKNQKLKRNNDDQFNVDIAYVHLAKAGVSGVEINPTQYRTGESLPLRRTNRVNYSVSILFHACFEPVAD